MKKFMFVFMIIVFGNAVVFNTIFADEKKSSHEQKGKWDQKQAEKKEQDAALEAPKSESKGHLSSTTLRWRLLAPRRFECNGELDPHLVR